MLCLINGQQSWAHSQQLGCRARPFQLAPNRLHCELSDTPRYLHGMSQSILLQASIPWVPQLKCNCNDSAMQRLNKLC